MRYYKDCTIVTRLPNPLIHSGRTIFNPTQKRYEEAGWRLLPEVLVGVPTQHIKWVDGEPIEMSEEERLSLEPTLEQKIEEVEQQRRIAYQEESDPIFFMWQRGEATEKDWLEKILEIKARYPKPEIGE